MNRASPRVSALLVAAVLLPMQVAVAQTANQQAGVIEEIVVTATYRETNLMDTPQAISAVVDDQVEDVGAQSMEDIFTLIPGLNMQGSTYGQSRYAIRGVSSQSGHIGYAPVGATVGVYLDGTPVTAALGPDNQVSGTLFDIERVEVLKGPQGTLFGEGSQGGTIRYLYKRPNPRGFDAAVNASIATMSQSDDQSNRLDAMVNLPIGEGAALRLTGWRSATAGFIDNLQPAEDDFNEATSNGLRAALGIERERFSLTGSILHSKQGTDGGVGTFEAYRALNRRIPGFPPESEDKVSIYSVVVAVDLDWASFESMTSFTDREITAVNESTSVGVAALDFLYGGSTEAAGHPDCAAVGAAFGLCPGFVGVLNFGGPLFTPDGNNLEALTDFQDHYSQRWVQEFRLVSASDQRLRWTAGAFWKDSEDHTQARQTGSYYPGREAFGERFDPLLRVPANTHTDFLEEWAFFGEATYDIAQDLELTVGARLSNLTQHFTNTNTGTDDAPISPKVVLSWQPADDLLLYGSYTTGFRPGNVNNNLEFYAGQFEQSIEDLLNTPGLDEAERQAGIAMLEQNIVNTRARLFFDGDKVSSYELGAKATLLNGRVAMLGSAYFVDWQDMIVHENNAAVAPGSDVFNANSGGAEIRGIEVELNAFLTERLNVRFAGDVNDSEVSRASEFATSAEGNSLVYAPERSLSLAVGYSVPLTGDWMLDLYLDRAWVAEQFSDANNSTEIPSYERSNGRATLRSQDGKWRVALFGTNLDDQEIIRGRTAVGVLYWHAPRQLGLEVGYRR